MVDFLAVGSNDLTQYMLAVDRNNPRCRPLPGNSPGGAQRLRKWPEPAMRKNAYLGICGELAGTPVGAVLLMAMGYHVLSMNATNLPKVKWVIRNIKRSDARRMLARVLQHGHAGGGAGLHAAQLIDAGLGRVLPTHHH